MRPDQEKRNRGLGADHKMYETTIKATANAPRTMKIRPGRMLDLRAIELGELRHLYSASSATPRNCASVTRGRLRHDAERDCCGFLP